MSNDFDKEARRLASGFRMEPRRDLWPRIGQELDERRRRRVAWWWWLTPLLLGGALWWGLGRQDTVEPSQPEQAVPRKIIPVPQQEQPQSLPPASAGSATGELPKEPGLQASDIVATRRSAAAAVAKGGSQSLRGSLEGGPAMALSGIQRPQSATATETATADKAGETDLRNDPPALEPNTESAVVVPEKSVSEKVAGMQPAVMDTALMADALPVVKAAVPPAADSIDLAVADKPIRRPSRGQWELVAGAGIHSLAESGMGKKAAVDWSANQPQAGGGFAQVPLQPNRAGAGFMVGIQRRQWIGASQRFSLSPAIQYQYQSIRQQSGERRDSLIAVPLNGSFSGVADRVSAPYFYLPGDSRSVGGHQHRLHLALLASWHFGSGRWSLQAGPFAGQVLSHRYLVPSGSTRAWVPSSSALVRRGYTGLDAGLQYRAGNRLTIGLNGQLTLTPALRGNLSPRDKWRSAELRLMYPLHSQQANKSTAR